MAEAGGDDGLSGSLFKVMIPSTECCAAPEPGFPPEFAANPSLGPLSGPAMIGPPPPKAVFDYKTWKIVFTPDTGVRYPLM